MSVNTMIWIKDALQVVFFLALLGCATTVLISWVKLLRDAFSSDDEDETPRTQQKTSQRTGSL